jgi:hypothetical protein
VSCDGGAAEGGAGCSQGCDGCPSHGDGGQQVCPSIPRRLLDRVSRESPWVAGLALGGFRGATPCLKVLIITPLLVANPAGTVVLMAVAFALTSTIYPLIGLLSGRALSNLLNNNRHLRLAAAVGLVAVGVIVVVRFYLSSCDVWG